MISLPDTTQFKNHSQLQGLLWSDDPINSRIRFRAEWPVSSGQIEQMISEGLKRGRGKIWGLVSDALVTRFLNSSFVIEGSIPGYNNGEHVTVMSCFISDQRHEEPQKMEHDALLSVCTENILRKRELRLSELSVEMRIAGPDDAEAISALMKEVFPEYPTACQPEDIRAAILGNSVFAVALTDGRMIASASLDICRELRNAEITDFATREGYRGKGMAAALMVLLENSAAQKELNTIYSIARAGSFGMNRILYLHGYAWTGRLVQNCRIGNGFEDMNLWVKSIQAH